jgi:hypothetical protein
MAKTWKKMPWWVEKKEETTDLTRNQIILKSRLPSYMVGINLIPKTRLLDRIRILVSKLPLNLFFTILLYLDLECAMFIEAIGLGDTLRLCLDTYPESICKVWSSRLYIADGPRTCLSEITPETVRSITNFAEFLASVTVGPLSSNQLYSKIMVDSINATFSAFNPRYNLIGMCLNNTFTYYVFSTDTTTFVSDPTPLTRRQHIKCILDLPNSMICGVSWSPDGEILAILTSNPADTPYGGSSGFRMNVVLAYYDPLTCIMRELQVRVNQQEIFISNSMFLTPNIWFSDNAFLAVDFNAKRFKKVSVNTLTLEVMETFVNTTKNLLQFVSEMDKNVTNKIETVIGCMSVSPHYPLNTATFIGRCAAHCGGSHSFVLFYNVVDDTCLKRINFEGYIRSFFICPKKTIYYTEQKFNNHFIHTIVPVNPLKCTEELWLDSKTPTDDGLGEIVLGDIYVIKHSDLSKTKFTKLADRNMLHGADTAFTKTSSPKNKLDVYASLHYSGLDRSLQACENYAYVCTKNNSLTQTITRISFALKKFTPVSNVNVPGRRRQACITIGKNGFLTFCEYSGF